MTLSHIVYSPIHNMT